MADEKFSINEALSAGWALAKPNFLILIAFGILAGVMIVVPPVLAKVTLHMLGKGEDLVLNVLAAPIQFVAHAIANMGIIKITLDVCDNRKPDLASFFSPLPQLLYFLVGAFLYNTMVTVGLFFLIVPGVILALTFQFYSYLIIDQQCGPIEALRKSAAITSGAKWNLLGLDVMVFLICIAGLLCLVIGIIPASIVSSIAVAHCYRQLLAQADKTALS